MNLLQLSDIAIKAALSAGKIIQSHLNDTLNVELKKSGNSYASQVVTAVDKECEIEILSHLLPTCEEFNIALLSEETEDNGSRFKEDYFWCIDPLDGTLAFINGYPGYSVSIALVGKDGTPQIGVVFDPSKNNLYCAIKGNGVFKNGTKWIIENKNDYLTYVTDRKLDVTPRANEIQTLLKEHANTLKAARIQEISGAGSVLNAMLVLENGPACMLKFPKKENGGGSIWDFAATACIYNELGRSATNYEGGKLDLNSTKNTFMNHEGVLYVNF